MGAGPCLIIAGLIVECVGAVMLVGRAAWRYFRAFWLGHAESRERIRKEAMAQAFNRLAYSTEEENLADPIARGFVTTYKSSLWGLILILAGLMLQVLGTYLSYY